MLYLVLKSKWSRASVRSALLIAIAFIIALFPWYYRNYFHSKTIIFSSIGGTNLLFYNVASIEAQRQNISWDRAREELSDELNERLAQMPRNKPLQVRQHIIATEIARKHLLAHPLESLLYQSLDALNSLRPGYSMATLVMRDDASQFGAKVQSGDLAVIGEGAIHEVAMFMLMTIYYAVLYVLSLTGSFLLIRQRRRSSFILISLILLWFLYAPGKAGNARFRVPTEGFFSLIAATGLVWLVAKVRQFISGYQHRSVSLDRAVMTKDSP